jgi:hypothetical protein
MHSSLSHRSKPTLVLSLLALCRFHLRLLFFHFLAFKCILLFVAFTSDSCSFTFYAFVSLSLPPPTVALSLSRFQMHSASLHSLPTEWRLRSRLNTCGFLAPSPFFYLSRCQRSLLIVSPSLSTEWRLCSKISNEAIMSLFLLLFFICVSRITLGSRKQSTLFHRVSIVDENQVLRILE